MKVKSLYPIIATDNTEKTIEFYKSLGFEIKHDAVTKMNSHVFVLSNGDLELEIMESVKNGPVDIPTGLYGLRMNVDDIEAATEELKQRGAEIVAGPIATDNGRNLMLKDNQGINITLIQHQRKSNM